jgi:hypothetical protein
MEDVLAFVGSFFMKSSPVHQAAEQIARLLRERHVDFAIGGALALGVHGYVRATEDVDVLIAQRDLDRFKEEWLGRGYVNLRPGGRALKDTVHGVKIDFLVVGDYPGDGKPKPVAFPAPAAVAIDSDDYPVISLPKLIELKLASGMTAPHRLQDLADVQRLIATRGLPRELAAELHVYVRAKYDELWQSIQGADDG